MSMQQRLNWVDAFETLVGMPGWFNNVKDIIRFLFESSMLKNLRQGSWGSLSDAGTLQAIQRGFATFRSGNVYTLAGVLWGGFFELRRNDPVNTTGLKVAWVNVEQAGVAYGIAMADANAGRPSIATKEGQMTEGLIFASNAFRSIASRENGGGEVRHAIGQQAGEMLGPQLRLPPDQGKALGGRLGSMFGEYVLDCEQA